MSTKLRELEEMGIDLSIWTKEEQEKIVQYLEELARLTNTTPKDFGERRCVYCGAKARRHNIGGLVCDKHDRRIRVLGGVLEFSKYTPNEILFFKDHANIVTRGQKGEVTYEFEVSLESVPLAIDYKWSANKRSKNGVYCENVKHGIRLHRYLTGATDPKLEVDHIDRNTFNNSLDNLHVVTHAQNGINKSLKSDNTSGYTGVIFHKHYGKWWARLSYEGKGYTLGYYDDKEDAIRARLQGECDICDIDLAPQANLFEEWGISKTPIDIK